MDLILAATGMVVASPLLLSYGWVRLTSPGPALFRQVHRDYARRE
jgi:lipopolysaccharide/colanic/teichoic acid biosynthesis glycosyltransferase